MFIADLLVLYDIMFSSERNTRWPKDFEAVRREP